MSLCKHAPPEQLSSTPHRNPAHFNENICQTIMLLSEAKTTTATTTTTEELLALQLITFLSRAYSTEEYLRRHGCHSYWFVIDPASQTHIHTHSDHIFFRSFLFPILFAFLFAMNHKIMNHD